MTIEQLIEYHGRRPFRPFRISLADGRSFVVAHPEVLARPLKQGRTFAVYDEEGLGHMIDLLMVVSFDDVRTNGRGGRAGR